MSKFGNNTNYGLVILASVIAAVVSSVITYKATTKNNVDFAVIDLQRVVVSSKDLEALRNERDNQIQELKKMADEANAKIQEIENDDDKKKASEKYLAEINTKKDEFDKIYGSALQASDQKLNNVINAIAEKEGLDIVINKASIVSGGVDITDKVIDLVQ